MLNQKGWDVWISNADGQELPQYKTTIEETSSIHPHNPHITHLTSKASCWIASEEGKEFSVHVANRAYVSSMCGIHVYMDGTFVTGRVVGPRALECKISGRKSHDLRTEAPFIFSRLSLTDDDSALRDVAHLKDLGIIRISIERVAVVPGPVSDHMVDTRSIAEKGPVHETSKKAGAHCVSYGSSKAVLPSSYVKTRSLDGKPFLDFEFRYRSADLLQAQDIMPSTKAQDKMAARPSNNQRAEESGAGPSVMKRKVKQEEEHDSEENVDEEIRALREKLKSLEKRRNKENKGDLGRPPAKKAKVEPSDHSNFVDGEVIDLTKDSKKKAKVEPLDFSDFVEGEVIDLT